MHRACGQHLAAVASPGLRQPAEQWVQELLVFPLPAAIPAPCSFFPGTEGSVVQFLG